MSDIFICYGSEDRPVAQQLAQCLEQQGWSVWWDRNIPAGRRFAEVIDQALRDAKCVVAIWSNTSVAKDWVLEEAAEARDRRILVPVMIDQVELPRGFRRVQAADLIGWDGTGGGVSFQKLVQDIGSLLGGSAGPPRQAASAAPPPRPSLAQQLLRPSPRRMWHWFLSQISGATALLLAVLLPYERWGTLWDGLFDWLAVLAALTMLVASVGLGASARLLRFGPGVLQGWALLPAGIVTSLILYSMTEVVSGGADLMEKLALAAPSAALIIGAVLTGRQMKRARQN